MKKKFELSGMSCGGCVSSVKRALLQLPDVTEADVQLRPQSAVLTLNKPVDVSQLQAQLSKAGHYTIRESVAAYPPEQLHIAEQSEMPELCYQKDNAKKLGRNLSRI